MHILSCRRDGAVKRQTKENQGTVKNNWGQTWKQDDTRVVATGYGRVAVDFADYVITEITCHARGGRELAKGDCAVIDVGGQDTKVILVERGMVVDFLMNDKCSAGTGKFLEIMANRLGLHWRNYLTWLGRERQSRLVLCVRYLRRRRLSATLEKAVNAETLPPE